MACCYSRSMLMAMYPDTEGCKCCHVKRRRDRVLRKKGPAEVVTTTTAPPVTENVDELVSMIEGTKIGKTTKRNSELSDPKKVAKKARQKERKKLEEETKRKALEEKLRELEVAKTRALEVAREEELQKKRDKKKKQRTNKKKDKIPNHSTGNNSESTAVPVVSRDPRNNNTVTSNFVHTTGQPATATNKSEMVTIRRHSTAPDTTVTISVKSETGNEDLLYTLVNGQVYPKAEDNIKGSAQTQSGGNAQRLEATKAKGKTSNKKNNVQNVMGKEIGHLSLDPTVLSYEGNWFGVGTGVTGNSNQSQVTPGVSTYLSPIVKNGPTLPSPPLSQATGANGPGNTFSFFSGSEGNEIDLTMLKLPPGITITKVNQPVSGQASVNGHDDKLHMPPPGAAEYNVDANMIVMNPMNLENDDAYDVDDYYIYGIPPPPEFEMVLSNKEKRKRRATKCDEREQNESSERGAHSREQTPGATRNFSSGRTGKPITDSGTKDLSHGKTNHPKSKRVSGKIEISGKSDDHKAPCSPPIRQSRPGQCSNPVRRSEGTGKYKMVNVHGQLSKRRYPSSPTPLPSAQLSPVSIKEEPSRPPSRNTPITLPDVVSGAYLRLSRESSVSEVTAILDSSNNELPTTSSILQPGPNQSKILLAQDKESQDKADYDLWVSGVGPTSRTHSSAYDPDSELSVGAQASSWQSLSNPVWEEDFVSSSACSGHDTQTAVSLPPNDHMPDTAARSVHDSSHFWNNDLLTHASSGYEPQASSSTHQSFGVTVSRHNCPNNQCPKVGRTGNTSAFGTMQTFSPMATHAFQQHTEFPAQENVQRNVHEDAEGKELMYQIALSDFEDLSNLLESTFKPNSNEADWSFSQEASLPSQRDQRQPNISSGSSSGVHRISPIQFQGANPANLGYATYSRSPTLSIDTAGAQKPREKSPPSSTMYIEFSEQARGHEHLLRRFGLSDDKSGPIPLPFINFAGGIFFPPNADSVPEPNSQPKNTSFASHNRPTDPLFQAVHPTGTSFSSKKSIQEPLPTGPGQIFSQQSHCAARGPANYYQEIHTTFPTPYGQRRFSIAPSRAVPIPYLTVPVRPNYPGLPQQPTHPMDPSISSGSGYMLF